MRPWVAAFAGFITMRACEQVRTYVAYPGLDVKLVGANGGIAGGGRDGATHQFIEDLGIMRSIPGITIVVPADAHQARRAVLAMAGVPGPGYIRIGSGRDPVVFSPDDSFDLGSARILEARGDDVALFTNGYMIRRTLEAAAELAADGIKATVVEVHTLKPLDSAGIAEVLHRTGAAVTVEDHNIYGALGSAVAEVIAEQAPAFLVRVGVRDVYAESGAVPALLDKYHLGVADIVAAARGAVERKIQRRTQ
jgi:transketolase